MEKDWNELRTKTLSSGKTFLVSEEEVETADGKIIFIKDVFKSSTGQIMQKTLYVIAGLNGTGKSTLTGKVTLNYQKEEVARLAWNAPGVWMLDNQLEVVYDTVLFH